MSDAENGGPDESLLQKITPDFIRRSFAIKFAIVLLLMGVSVGVIGLAATDQVRSETQENVRNEYERSAEQEGALIEQWVSEKRFAARVTSSSQNWTQDENLDLVIQNRRQQLSGEEVAGLHLVRRSIAGTSIVASSDDTIDDDTPVGEVNRNWVTSPRFNGTDEVAMSSVYQTSTDQYVVGFLSPVPQAENRYVLIEYKLDSIANSLQGADRAEGGFTQVVNESGTIQIDEPPAGERGLGDEVLTSYSNGQADAPIQRATALRNSQQQAGVIEAMDPNSNVIDETYTVGYAPVSGTEWVVLVHAPYSSVFGFVQQIQTWGLIATIGEVILIGAVGAALGYSTSTTIDRLTRKAETIREGDLDVEIQSTRIDNIGRLYDSFDDMRNSLKEQIDEAERARKEAEVSRAEAVEMSNYLQEKADDFSQVMEATAAGDMTQRLDAEGENEAMDRIAEEFNQMMDELEKTTGQLKSFSEEVAESGDVVLSSAESVREASEEVADSVQRVSDDAYEQQERLQNVSENLDDLVASLEDMQAEHPELDLDDTIAQFDDIATSLQEAADTSEQMMAESENVAGAAEEQAAELNEVSSRAEKLKRYARPLGDILERFETEAEHEFVFSGGPSQSTQDDDET